MMAAISVASEKFFARLALGIFRRRAEIERLAVQLEYFIRIINGRVQIMRDHYDRNALLAVQAADYIIKLRRGDGIKSRYGLVEQQQLFRRAKGARQQHALLLAAGKLAVAGAPDPCYAELFHIFFRAKLIPPAVKRHESL